MIIWIFCLLTAWETLLLPTACVIKFVFYSHRKQTTAWFMEKMKKVNFLCSKIHKLGYELLPHLPYSPDLALNCYCLFPNLKKCHNGKRFDSKDEILSKKKTNFDDQTNIIYFSFLEGIKTLDKECRDQRKLLGWQLTIWEFFFGEICFTPSPRLFQIAKKKK